MIKSFQIANENLNALEILNEVLKRVGVVNLLKNEGTPESISRIENIEELINAVQDFIDGQKEIVDSNGSLNEFLEDVALATDLDANKGDADHVALMTIHLAKGLEFPYVFIVGLEEDLFPSAMSMSTRSELEEERRLFYVALTRAEKQAYLTYALSRYRWGKLIDSEPSRFIEEIDDKYVEILTPPEERRFNPMLSADIFGDVEPNTIRYKPAKQRAPVKKGKAKPEPENFRLSSPKKFKSVASSSNGASNLFDNNLTVGNMVKHLRFGKGEVLKIEGKGADLKAEINENDRLANLSVTEDVARDRRGVLLNSFID